MKNKMENSDNGSKGGIDWVEQYQNTCPDAGPSLSITPVQIFQHAAAAAAAATHTAPATGTTIQSDTDANNSMEDMLRDLSETCIIVSPYSSVKDYHYSPHCHADNNDNNRLAKNHNCMDSSLSLVMRFNANHHKQMSNSSSSSPASSSFLWRQFSSLGLTKFYTRDNAHAIGNSIDNSTDIDIAKDKDKDGDRSSIDNDRVLDLASYVLANRIAHTSKSTECTPKVAPDVHTDTKSEEGGISRRWISKASTMATSILAYYDLAEAPIVRTSHEDGDEDGHDEDDAFANYGDDHSTYEECLVDDAIIHHPSTTDTDTQTDKPRETALRQSDVLWNIPLLCDAWKLILQHATYKIKCAHPHHTVVSTTLVHEDAIKTIPGILLHRRGDGDRSFLLFCRDAGNYALTQNQTTTTTTTTDRIAQAATVLTTLQNEITLELLASTLLSTRRATTSPDGTILALCPDTQTDSDAADPIPPPTPTPPDGRPVPPTRPSVHEADLAVFKLESAVRSLELRIESLSTQIERHTRLASKAKNDGDSRTALYHLKRRRMVSDESDGCSASLLNLETGLHGLERARSDVQVLDVYETMNSAVKALRETTAGFVDVIDEFGEERRELEEVQDCMVGMNLGYDGAGGVSDEDLERELECLEDDEGGVGVLENGPDDRGPSEGHNGVAAAPGGARSDVVDGPVPDSLPLVEPSMEIFSSENKATDDVRKETPVIQ